LPTPLAPLDFFGKEDQARLLPIYEARMLAEIQQMCAAIPPQELSLQWDTAVEFAILEGVWPSPFGPPAESVGPIIDMLVRIGDAVPGDVELGYHLCYGDAAHKHFVEPQDTSRLAEVAFGVTSRLRRPVDWLHFPVPRNRFDQGYLSAMRDAQLRRDMELYVGLVHLKDGTPGTQARIATAQRVLDRPFGIATECGLGRRQPSTVPGLLRMQARLAAPIASA
jgi:hypothetical protein